MPSVTVDLKELHQTHLQLEKARETLEKGPRQIKARETLVAKRKQELKDYLDELKQTRMQADSQGLELKTTEKKIEEYKAKLNIASSNREFDTIKGQIAKEEERKSDLEDALIEMYDSVEEKAAEQAQYDAAIEEAEENLKTFRTDFEAKKADLEKTIAQLEVELTEQQQKLPSEPAQKYHRLVNQKGSKALAPVHNGACANCYVGTTAQQKIMIKTGSLLFCTNCGSLLYTDDES